MQKSEFLKRIQDKMGEDAMPLTKTDDVVAATFAVIADVMTEKDSVTIPGFGSFTAKERPERPGLNPQTKEKIIVPAGYSPKFKASAGLKKRVNTGA